MKGQASYPFSMMEAAFTFLLLIGVIYGSQAYTETFLREETAGAQANRIRNAAIAVDSMPKGHLELSIEEYKYKINGSNLTLNFNDANETVNLEDNIKADYINGSTDFKELKGLCIKKKNISSTKVIDFTSGGC